MDILIFAFKFAWGFISVIVMSFWNNIVQPVVHWISEAWHWAAGQVTASFDAWMKVIKTVWNWLVSFRDDIVNNWVHPIVTIIKDYLVAHITEAWHNLQVALQVLQSIWSSVWESFKGIIKGVWDFIKPIFDKIQAAFHDLQGALSNLNPGKLGGDLAHILGFAEGGMVPGPKGAATLAVVHGGEYVLNTGQVDTMRNFRGVSTIASPSVAAAAITGGSYGGGNVTVPVYVDGKKLFDVMVQRAQRHKSRNNSTFLT